MGKKIFIVNRVPFPTSAYMAKRKTSISANPAKYALICGNHVYSKTSKYESDLKSAKFDAQMMEKALKARGYKCIVKFNCTAADLKSALKDIPGRGIPGGQTPKSGDEICFCYSGHGEPEGLRSAQDGPAGLVETKVFVDVAKKAFAKGLHLTFSLDACHSGAISDAIRLEATEVFKVGNAQVKVILKHARSLQKIKSDLAKAENKMHKVFVKSGHVLEDLSLAQKSGNQAKIKAAEAAWKKDQADSGKKIPVLEKEVLDLWFSNARKIKSSLRAIKSKTGLDLNSKARYGKLQKLLSNASKPRTFKRWWQKHNNHNNFRPEEHDDLDDMINATLEYVRTRNP